MFGQWLDRVINGCSNIYRWEGKQKLIRRNDSYPGAFYRINHFYTNNNLYTLKQL